MRFLLLAAMALLAGCASVPRDEAPGVGDADAATVYVVRRGWHTDIGFAVRDLDGPLAAVAGNFPGANYLVVGFGDRGYLEARERGAADLLALWPGEGLMLATGLEATPQQAFGADEVVELRLRRQAMAAVRSFVQDSFRVSTEGQPTGEAPGPYAGSLFFASSLRYSGMHTCNTWTAQALRAGKVPVQDEGVIFAWQLWSQLR